MKNCKPEKIVENLVVHWCIKNNFWMHVIDSKATYSQNLKMYLRGNAPEGFPDMNGITPCGYPCYIELKSPGKRSTTSYEQIMFLCRAIKRGAFAIVADSPEVVDETYKSWIIMMPKAKKRFLLGRLPNRFRTSVIQSVFSPSELVELEISIQHL